MNAKKSKRIRPKKIWAFRLSEIMLAEVARRAAEKEMRPSEYVRRIIEAHLASSLEKGT